jgi:hypothetical protein
MARPKNIEKTKQNLQPIVALDAPGLTPDNSKPVSVRLHIEDIAKLDKLGSRSYLIRQAVKKFLETNH